MANNQWKKEYTHPTSGKVFTTRIQYFELLFNEYLQNRAVKGPLYSIAKFINEKIKSGDLLFSEKKIFENKMYEANKLIVESKANNYQEIKSEIARNLAELEKQKPVEQVIENHKTQIIAEAVEKTKSKFNFSGQFYKGYLENIGATVYNENFIEKSGELAEMVLTEDLLEKLHDKEYMSMLKPAEHKQLFEMARSLRGRSFTQTSAVDLEKEKQKIGEMGAQMPTIIIGKLVVEDKKQAKSSRINKEKR